jgi:hypothetical protein
MHKDRMRNTTIQIENPTDETIVATASTTGVKYDDGSFVQTSGIDINVQTLDRAAFDRREVQRRIDELNERNARITSFVCAYGRALIAAETAKTPDEMYEADVAIGESFDELVEAAKKLARG